MKLKIANMPSPPVEALTILKMLWGDSPDYKAIASYIRNIPSLEKTIQEFSDVAGNGRSYLDILEANSKSISSDIENAVLTLAFCSAFIEKGFGKKLEIRSFCSHSLATGIIMQDLGEYIGAENGSDLFKLGLLNGLGVLVLDSIMCVDYEVVMKLIEDGLPLGKAEEEVYNLNNHEAWLFVAEEWDLPEELINLWQGWIKGKVQIQTKRFVQASRCLADIAGCLIFTPVSERSLYYAFDFNLFSFIDDERICQISSTLHEKLKPYCKVLDLASYDSSEVCKVLIKSSQALTKTNTKSAMTQKALSYRIQDLGMLAKVFTSIIKSLEGDSLAFSVLESLIEGFQLDSAFMVNKGTENQFSGYAAQNNSVGGPSIDLIEMTGDNMDGIIKSCMECKVPLLVELPEKETTLIEFLGPISLVWLIPVVVNGEVLSILGLGVGEADQERFGRGFANIIEILSAEINLAVENTTLYRKICNEADTDPLTGISNRRNILQILNTEFARFQRKQTTLTVGILDLDHFKIINDVRGHLAGDDYLIDISTVLQDEIRETDYTGRYGGDEFIVVFPYTSIEDATVVMERIRNKLCKVCRENQDSDISKKLSVSVGLATANISMTRSDDLINAADAALYMAKESGRDRLVVYNESTATRGVKNRG